AVWVLLPEGPLLVHRIGSFGRWLELDPSEKVTTQISGFLADQYYLIDSDEGIQEELLTLVEREGAVWEVRSEIAFKPGYERLTATELAGAREALRKVVDTIRLP
ncbi:MAG TPA: hypothetical protein VFT91_06085, partial [Dehalococcoidia bacterium]|nr:hypothetical protein [Dehalococcoidia bacterium]